MSNLVKASGRYGPGFDSGALFGETVEVSVALDPKTFRILRPLEGVSAPLFPNASQNENNLFYQDSVANFTVNVSPVVLDGFFYGDVLDFEAGVTPIVASVGQSSNFTIVLNLS
jgi:hypothetical protein